MIIHMRSITVQIDVLSSRGAWDIGASQVPEATAWLASSGISYNFCALVFYSITLTHNRFQKLNALLIRK